MYTRAESCLSKYGQTPAADFSQHAKIQCCVAIADQEGGTSGTTYRKAPTDYLDKHASGKGFDLHSRYTHSVVISYDLCVICALSSQLRMFSDSTLASNSQTKHSNDPCLPILAVFTTVPPHNGQSTGRAAPVGARRPMGLCILMEPRSARTCRHPVTDADTAEGIWALARCPSHSIAFCKPGSLS